MADPAQFGEAQRVSGYILRLGPTTPAITHGGSKTSASTGAGSVPTTNGVSRGNISANTRVRGWPSTERGRTHTGTGKIGKDDSR